MKRVNILPSKHVKSGHYRPFSETPSERSFAGRPMVARILMLATFFNRDSAVKNARAQEPFV